MTQAVEKYAEEFAAEIRHFQEYVDRGYQTNNEELKELCHILSRLLRYGEECPDIGTETDVEAPEISQEALKQRILARFPSFGIYNKCDPIEEPLGQAHATLGDAADDIYDIYQDLGDSRWYIENGQVELGLWNAKLLFGHWARHAIDLKGYLHRRIYDW